MMIMILGIEGEGDDDDIGNDDNDTGDEGEGDDDDIGNDDNDTGG